MTAAFEALIRLFYPASCGVCKNLLTLKEAALCLDCAVRLEEKRFDWLEAIDSREKRASWDEAWALFPYESPIQDLIKAAKFNSKPWLLKAFHPALKDFSRAVLTESSYDLMVPVPQGKLAWVERQYNPAEKIAAFLSTLGIPLDSSILGKRSRIPIQSSLGREERLANPWGAFKMLRPGRVLNRRILVVDDILTTGATAEEVCRLIRDAGASKVGVLTLARTPAKISFSRK